MRRYRDDDMQTVVDVVSSMAMGLAVGVTVTVVGVVAALVTVGL